MKFDILGVGNALVDETFYVEKNFVDSSDLFFNQFKSISFEDQEDILSGLPSDAEPDVVCGGSTTNSLAATSNFGSNCAHICQLANDQRGKLYENNLKENGITSINSFYHEEVRTGRCLVFITPNSERTMGTYLGAQIQALWKLLKTDLKKFSKLEKLTTFFAIKRRQHLWLEIIL